MRNPFKRKRPISDAGSYPTLFRSVRTRPRKFFGHWWGWAITAALVLILSLSGFGVWYYLDLKEKLGSEIDNVEDPEKGEDGEEPPFNLLLVGSDSRAGLTEEEQFELGADEVEGERADTLIVAHLDPPTGRVTMVQFPRDYWVPLPNGEKDRINEALGQFPKNKERSQEFMVQTVESLTGIDVNGYAQVNIAGFRDLVDAIDGVEICITEPIPFDPATGIEVTEDELGMVKFDGDKAIRFVRSRKVFATGDFARIQNQQKFLAAAIDKILTVRSLIDPWRLNRIKGIAGDNLSVSENIADPLELKRLANQLSDISPANYEVYTAPNLGPTVLDSGASVVLPDMPALDLVFDKIKANESPADDGVPDIAPSKIKVGVYNGTGGDGVATTASDKLKAATAREADTLNVVEIEDADSDDYKQTIVRYAKGAREKGELIAAALPGAKLEQGKTRKNVDVAVIVGTRFKTKRLVQITPIEIPEPGEVPEECR